MTAKRTAAAAAAAVILGLMASGCSSSDSSPSSSPLSTAPTSRMSGGPPTTANPTQDAQAQAAAFVPTYLQTIDGLYLDPSRSLNEIYQVALAPDAVTEATAIGRFRAQGHRQTGRMRLVSAAADNVDLTNSPAAAPSPAFPTVVITACVDVSQVGAVDAAGQSIVPVDRPGYLIERLSVVNPHYPDPSSWRVSKASNRQARSCAG